MVEHFIDDIVEYHIHENPLGKHFFSNADIEIKDNKVKIYETIEYMGIEFTIIYELEPIANKLLVRKITISFFELLYLKNEKQQYFIEQLKKYAEKKHYKVERTTGDLIIMEKAFEY